ncbi:MAG: amidase family protein, partial [Chloroflexota bacterium]
MSNFSEIIQLTATQMQHLITTKKLSPVEVVEAHLAQIEQLNHSVNAVCTVSEQVLDDAGRAEQAIMADEPLGILHGLPVGVKDVTPTAGLRTTFGSPLYTDYIPAEDALVVQRLKAAGAIILGKTNVPEFALGANTYNEIFGATRNPWNTALTAGGSTGGGAVALATGMIALAEGSDLGGSLRIPASFCGVVGLRPSPGLVPTYPSTYLWDTLNVTGPMARTAEDVALMLQAIAGPTARQPLRQPIDSRDFVATVQNSSAVGLKIAYCPDIAGIGIDTEIEQICRDTVFDLKKAGAIVEEINLDLSFGWQAFLDLRGLEVVTVHHQHLDKVDQ